MSWTRPTLPELARRAEAELQVSTGINEADAALRRNLFTPIARAVAGLAHGLHGQQEWIAKQFSPITCDMDTLYAVFVPIFLPDGAKAAEAASGPLRIFGTSGSGIDQGRLWTRADGLEYTNPTGAVMPSAGYLDITVVCTTPGEAGSTEPGGALQLVNPVVGINGAGAVQEPGITGGADAEDDDSVRARVIAVRQAGGEVGRSIDWENWAKEVPGVTRAWCAPKLAGRGTVTVFFVRDDDDSIFPDTPECATVQTHLESTGTPWGEIYAVAPINKPIDFTIRISPNTPAVRAAALSALQNVIDLEAGPVARDANNATALPLAGVTIPLSHLSAALSAAVGEYDHALILPAGDVVCAIGELATMGAATWQT